MQYSALIKTTHQWKKDIERHLRMVECTETQKQMLATFTLVGDALQWWESITTMEERTTLTYDQFQDRFDDKYFSFAVSAAKKKEFLNLQQGDRTVAEYEQEFTNLSLFALEEVNIEVKKRACFLNGLTWPIKKVILGSPAYTTYSQVVDAALQHCQARKDYKRSMDENQNDKDSINHSAEGDGARNKDTGGFQGH
ncbi:uncharacterized protein LOC132301685 [Cornus florida]|uniref:uncharacterized protein LOC132301685 n=1 Tax=Cornus florida TaxID=4283 RepID=UPI00289A9501|nr:uncharacterized protein LOC132301685 [Cornus florida]